MEIIKVAKNLLVIDHHKTAQADLSELDQNYKIFDLNFSGAVLTWTYFFPDKNIPLFIKYIQDRDIWTKLLPNIDEFAGWFYTLPFEFEIYNKYLDDNIFLENLKTNGMAYRDLNQYYINQALENITIKFCKINNNYYFVGYLNSTILKSDIGNKILEKIQLLDFSAIFSIQDNITNFSLRSTDNHVDVSQIATIYGGGGHRNASGVQVQLVTSILPSIIYEPCYSYIKNIYFDKITINNKIYNTVYLFSPVNKRKLGLYLLQVKFNNIQNCQNIFNINNNLPTNNNPTKFEIAVVFDYCHDHNTGQNYTYFAVNTEKLFLDLENLNNFFGVDISASQLKYPGINKIIPIDLKPILE